MLQFFSVYLGLIFLWSHWDTRVQIARILLGYCPRIFLRFSNANGTRAERCDRSNFQWRWGHIQLPYACMRRFVANYPPPFILKKNVLILIILLLNIVISRHRWSLLVIHLLIWEIAVLLLCRPQTLSSFFFFYVHSFHQNTSRTCLNLSKFVVLRLRKQLRSSRHENIKWSFWPSTPRQ